ncbi:MAG: DNA polymerase III subunit alpha [Clostridia bacterium]|nr:DNA polymerase III subunit alpha [Clostridia bacterium]
MGFVHLHVHTEYSLLDGACKVKKMPGLIKEMGQTAVAMTDHGNMYGTIYFYKYAKAAGIKPIIGCEVYTAARTRFDKTKELDGNNGHLILLCKDNKGYKNLIEMVSVANLEGFYYKPRVDIELLEKYHEGLICLSACLAGDVPQLLLADRYDDAKALALKYLSIFGDGNYYLELQDHGIEEQKKVMDGLLRISRETGIPLVATNDAHYLQKKDAHAQKVLIYVQIQKTIDEESGMGFSTDEFYLKSEDEMRSLFEFVPEALDNTVKIAEQCNVVFPEIDDAKNRVYYLPVFKWTEGLSHYDYLRKLTFEGFEQRYTPEQRTKELVERVEYELDIINRMGFVDYFLIVWDFINYAKSHGIPIGPGRGSGAGSIVAYCTRITNIEPIRYNLIFERFLNPERISMPDFDVDMCPVRRNEVFEYVQHKYGEKNVANIVTFITLKAKAAIKDVARVLGFSVGEANRLTKMIPDKMTIREAVTKVPELKSLYESDDRIRDLLDTSETIENSPRNPSVHACGIVIAENPIYTYVPVAVNDGVTVSQFDMKIVEEVGLVKMDFLGLRNLTVIEDACKLVRKKVPDFDIEKIDIDDPEVYELLSRGETDGIFQLESGGMKQTLVSLKPKSIEDITAIISLYRPGPMDNIPTYIYNKSHPESIQYKHPLLENSLKVTYGVMVYQEQVMQIVRELAGYSYGRADIVRKAMGKKQMEVMAREREYFINGKKRDDGTVEIPGCVANGVPANVANEIFDDMIKFAEYAFNKSHAAAYAYVTYYTAFLKTHYKREYMAALLTSVLGKTDKMVGYINECTKQSIEVIPPDINESEDIFSVSKDKIRFGLSGVKNVGQGAISDIIDERAKNGPFKSFYDFCNRMFDGYSVDSKTVESLIRCGAFDCFNQPRRQLEVSFPEIRKLVAEDIKEREEGQMNLFGGLEAEEAQPFVYPDVPEYPKREKLKLEKEVTGIYLTDHPMKEYEEDFARSGAVEISSIYSNVNSYQNNDTVCVFGILTKVTRKMTRSDKQMMICVLQDLSGSIEVLVFGKSYDEFSSKLVEDKIVKIEGKLSIKEDMSRSSSDEDDDNSSQLTASIVLNSLEDVDERKASSSFTQPYVPRDEFAGKTLYINFREKDGVNFNKCVDALVASKGSSPVFFRFIDKKKQGRFSRCDVQISAPLITTLKGILGNDGIEVR